MMKCDVGNVLYNNRFVILILLYLSVSFYFMNESSPLRCDDLIYQYHWVDERTDGMLEPIDLNNRIHNFSDAFESQINHYKVMNGRFVVHYVVQCFCGFLGKPIFNIVNTIVYLLFLIGCLLFLEVSSCSRALVAVSLLWLGLPIQHIFYYSVSFSINYLWTSTFLVYYLVFLRRIVCSCNIKRNKVPYLFILSFFLGAMHEGFSIPLCAMSFVYMLFCWRRINLVFLIMSIGLSIGTVFLLLSPGTIGRGSSALSNESISNILLMKLDVLRYSKRLFVLMLLLVSFYLVDKSFVISFIKKHILVCIFILIDFCFVMVLPHYSQRVEFPLELLSLLLMIDLMFYTNIWKKIKYLFCVVIILALLHAPLTVYYTNIINSEYRIMLNRYLTSSKGLTYYENIIIPKPFSSYVKRLDDGVERNYISFTMGKEMVIEK